MPFIGRGGSSPPSDTTEWEPPHLPSLQQAPLDQPGTTVPGPSGSATIAPEAAPGRFGSSADETPADASDAAAIQRLLVATAHASTVRTSRPVPNPAPPAHPAARRRAAAARTSPAARPGASRAAAPVTPVRTQLLSMFPEVRSSVVENPSPSAQQTGPHQ